MSRLDDTVKEFLTESYENLDQLDRDLVALEKDPTARATLDNIFRTVHTIKGSCGFLDFSKLEALAHAGENLLGLLREGQFLLDVDITSALLAMVDGMRQILAHIEATQTEGDADYTDLIESLACLQERAEASATPASNQAMADSPTTSGATTSELRLPNVSDSNIRVDIALLDKLMNQVGELVLARNQILQFATTQEDTAFLAASQRLNLITSELQEGIMKTRMQPIGTIWSKFRRVVRDLATTQGKQVRITMEGQETELDKGIIEAIKDPLTHLVRNAVDHGIEPPEVRRAGGKPTEGHLYLRAFHEGGQVNIVLSDDGVGIDPEGIKQAALKRSLITQEDAGRMTDQQLTHLIFRPGFSTAAQVTKVSGRGVGMDVVKNNIEKVGGIIDVQSEPGRGTTFKIKIPLTLAIIPALIVTSGANDYAIPQVSLVELVRLEGAQARTGVEMMHNAPVHRLRGNLLPLVYLNRELHLEAGASPSNGQAEAVVNIMVLQVSDHQFGLVVDKIKDTQEIVVKPLWKQLKGIALFSGATIMGDGKVALILDVPAIAQRARVISELQEQALIEEDSGPEEHEDDRQALLLFRGAGGERMAISLATVARLEELSRSVIERTGDRDVVQYRGQILPLIYLAEVFSERRDVPGTPEAIRSDAENESLHVIVVSFDQGHSVGLVVDRILDIVEERLTVKGTASREGVLYTTVIQEQVTELLDVGRLIRRIAPTFFEQPAAATAEV